MIGPASETPLSESGAGRLSRRRQRQPHDKFRAFAKALAMRLNGAAMELDEPPDQRKTQPQAAHRISAGRVHPRKDVEHAGQRLWREADAVIRDRENGVDGPPDAG